MFSVFVVLMILLRLFLNCFIGKKCLDGMDKLFVFRSFWNFVGLL